MLKACKQHAGAGGRGQKKRTKENTKHEPGACMWTSGQGRQANNKPMHVGESARWADKLTKGERPTRTSTQKQQGMYNFYLEKPRKTNKPPPLLDLTNPAFAWMTSCLFASGTLPSSLPLQTNTHGSVTPPKQSERPNWGELCFR